MFKHSNCKKLTVSDMYDVLQNTVNFLATKSIKNDKNKTNHEMCYKNTKMSPVKPGSFSCGFI